MLTTYLQTLRLFSRDLRLFLAASACVGFAYFGVYALLLNLYLLRLGYGPAFIGLVNASGPLVLAVGGLPVGALSQRWGSRRGLMLGFSLLTLGFGLLPLGEFIPVAARAGWLLATYMLAWLGGTCFSVNVGPFLMGATTGPERNHAFAMQSAVLALAGFAGSLVGGLLPSRFAALLGVALDQPAPYRYPLWIAAALLLPAVLAAWAIRPHNVEQTQTALVDSDAPPYTLLLLITLVMLLRTAGEWAMRIFFNVYLDAGLHVSTALIGVLAAVGQLLGVAALSAPLVIGRWGKVRIISWGIVGVACAFLPLILITHWVGVGLGFIGMIALVSLINPTFNVFSQERVSPRWRTTMSGSINMALGSGIAAMALGGGYLIEALGYRMLFVVSAGLTLAGALLFFVCFRHAYREVTHHPIATEPMPNQGG